MASDNPYLLTLPALMSAKSKLGKVAAFYDPGKTSLSGFDSVALNPTQFREQLRRNFFIKLTDAELGAIVVLFDKDGDGKVDSVEFINEFFRLGVMERKKLILNDKEKRARIKEWQNQMLEAKKKRYEAFGIVKVADSWTPAQQKSAINKIAQTAFSYDNMKGGLGVRNAEKNFAHELLPSVLLPPANK